MRFVILMAAMMLSDALEREPKEKPTPAMVRGVAILLFVALFMDVVELAK